MRKARSPEVRNIIHGKKQQAQPNSISISTRSVSPSTHLLKQLGQSEHALKRECCQRAYAANSASKSHSGSRSFERKSSKQEEFQSLPKLSNIKQSATPIACGEERLIKEQTTNKSSKQRQRQPNSQRKQVINQRDDQ